MRRIIQPEEFVPANEDTRAERTVGAGQYSGTGIKAKVGRDRVSSTVARPRDITKGFKKKITQA